MDIEQTFSSQDNIIIRKETRATHKSTEISTKCIKCIECD